MHTKKTLRSYFFCEHKQRIKRLEWKWRLCVIQLRGKEDGFRSKFEQLLAKIIY